MKRKTSKIMDEISKIDQRSDINQRIESNADNVVASVSNLIELIKGTYEDKVAGDLIKRLMSSIRSGDIRKFQRGMKALVPEIKTEHKTTAPLIG